MYISQHNVPKSEITHSQCKMSKFQLKITECLWLDQFVDKIIRKHQVYPEEVEEMFSRDLLIRRLETGKVKGEDLFIAFGTTNSGRYLTVLFVRKKDKRALVITLQRHLLVSHSGESRNPVRILL